MQREMLMAEKIRNIVMKLSYDGTRYDGWQRQGNTKNTIQGKLESLLSRLLKEPIDIHGSGRTDAGVHAAGQVANFLTHSEMSVKEMLQNINHYLPEDIAALELWEAQGRFHSRLNAQLKHYRYRILNSATPNVFAHRYLCRLEEELDLDAMKAAAAYCLGKHDFKSFCANKHMKKSTVRRIENLTITREGEELLLDFYGNGFLYHMARILTGTIIEVGLHKRSADSVPGIFAAKKREAAGFTAPAQGLCLMEVFY